MSHEGQHKKKESDRDNWDRELDKGKVDMTTELRVK